MAITAVNQAEVLVSKTTATQLDTGLASRLYIEVANNSNGTIWLVPTTGAAPTITVRKAIPVQPGAVWMMALGPTVKLYALYEYDTDQLSGEATIVTEYAGT